MTRTSLEHPAHLPALDQPTALLRIARSALALVAGAALCRVGLAILAPTAGAGSDLQLISRYAGTALVAVALRWGIGRHLRLARWGTLVAGVLMAVVLVAGRAEFGLYAQHIPMPVVEALLFPARLIILSGFIVAGICCTIAPRGGLRWRSPEFSGPAA